MSFKIFLYFFLFCSSSTLLAAEEGESDKIIAVSNIEKDIDENDIKNFPAQIKTNEGDLLNLNELQRVVVGEPFVNLQTGAGRGYPIYHIAEQDQSLWIIRRKVNWFFVTTHKGKVGWVELSDMIKMKNPDGTLVEFSSFSENDYLDRTWEIGFRTGDFEGANVLAGSFAWQLTQNLSAEFVYGQGIGDFSEVRQITGAITNTPWPEWTVAPYFGVGTGIVKVNPSAALVQEVDRQDEVVFVTTGIKTYITQRFLLRAEYRHYAVLTTQETNEEIEEWTLGFSVFF
ncbi:MAG: hypothetical protein HWE27_15055 [Gammaproteobacteria bacterium]|nr:hypothetical protein [Gammaproteobacteria bacterium]